MNYLPVLVSILVCNFFKIHFMMDCIQKLPLDKRRGMWFMQDGAPPQFHLVRSYLNNKFPVKWIRRRSEFPRPDRSPDFNPLDFIFWHMKTLVYFQETNIRQELWQEIETAANSICNQQYISESYYKFFLRELKNVLKWMKYVFLI